MCEHAFRNADDVLRKEAGCAAGLDCAGPPSWLLVLKSLDGLEPDRAAEAALARNEHRSEESAVWKFRIAAADGKSSISGTVDDPGSPDDGRVFAGSQRLLYQPGPAEGVVGV